MNTRVGLNTDFIEGVDLVTPRNVIGYTENGHGDAFINFLCDAHFAKLNGRFKDNDFTCISTKGKSVVDYICTPYEDIDTIANFDLNYQ